MDFDAELIRGTTVPIVLELLSEREMYGYQIVRVVNERTDGLFEWKEGTLYPCLHKLASDGLLSARWQAAESGKRRKYYRITARGERELARRKAEWKRFAHGVNVLLMGVTA